MANTSISKILNNKELIAKIDKKWSDEATWKKADEVFDDLRTSRPSTMGDAEAASLLNFTGMVLSIHDALNTIKNPRYNITDATVMDLKMNLKKYRNDEEGLIYHLDHMLADLKAYGNSSTMYGEWDFRLALGVLNELLGGVV